jgi:feruloyl esterase
MSSRKTPLDASLHRIAKLGYVLTGALLTTTILGASPAAATPTCASLTGTTIPTSATNPTTTIPPATINSAVDTPAANGLPEYCAVTVTVGNDSNPANNTDILVSMPLPANWQHRYLHVGGGGFDGRVPAGVTGAFATFNFNPLAEGIVVAGSNGGHNASGPGGYAGASFAANQTLVLGYAWTALEYTDVVANALIRAYYGLQPTDKYFRYFTGCSNGGKNASVAAGKLGDNYDGVIGGDGVWGRSSENVEGGDMGGLTATWARVFDTINALPNIAVPGYFTPTGVGSVLGAKLTALANAEIAACDKLDGLADGIISNPSQCVYHPQQLACPSGTDNSTCLTPAEIAALKTLRSELIYTDGRSIGAPYTEGNMGSGLAAIFGGGASLGGGFLDLAFNNATFNESSFNLAKDYKFIVDRFNADYMNGSTADIAKYLEKGGKLILWHGQEDALIPVKITVRFWERLLQMTAANGQGNVQIYTPPGVNHCSGGPGSDSVDLVTPLIEWVEHGTAPKTLLTAKVVGTTTTFTRPLCVHPKYAKYINGNVNEATSFTCVNP